jgi:hypothetical protein
MVDTCASKAYAERHAGSSPALGIFPFSCVCRAAKKLEEGFKFKDSK